MAWRPMTAEELVNRPEARLEGSLLLIVLCAAALGVAAVLSLLAALVAIPAALTMSGSAAGGLFAVRGPAALGALYAVTTVYLMGWALVFSIMTIMRSASAPRFAAGGLVGWIAVRLVISIAGQFWIASSYGGGGAAMILQSVLPMLLGFAGEVMLVTGFWIYMRDGARPNGYYRRLVQV